MTNTILKIVIGIVIGLGIAYFFLWGKPYLELKPKYEQLNQTHIELQQKYDKLSQDYISLQSDYNKLRDESTQALKELKACKGRETFFTWVDRFSSLAALAKFLI